MIVRDVKDVIGTEHEVRTDNWVSRRVYLKDDGMGFSFHETTIFPGTETHIHYKNHNKLKTHHHPSRRQSSFCSFLV